MVIWVIKTFFVQFFCVFLHLFLISSASVRCLPFLFFIVSILAWNVPFISPVFLKRSVFSHSIVCPPFLMHYSFKKAFMCSLLFFEILHSVGFIFPFLPRFSLLFFPQLFIKPPQTTTLPSCISFSWGLFWSLPPLQFYKPLSIVLQPLCL